ncbi:paraquat-inducible protein A [Aliiruegeria sabulilitoris]|uniref:paraquat-inducible protein A n=1 Tax=Aliiruegeria sabulilitoris TaxID=1510458 RepID=UPI00082A8205|nr:paraquat-inducible protein A [Aliiruegeria sabulilitoris]
MPSTQDIQADLEELIACPACDALYRAAEPENGERAVCPRCHTVLIAPVDGAVIRVVAFALAILVLLVSAMFMPFLSIEAGGLSHSTSIADAALSFSEYQMLGLSIGVVALIIFVPIARAILVIFALFPLMLDKKPWRGARTAFRLSEELRPWSMAEIFVLGVGVALVKVAAMAHVELGMAFWLFVALVLVTVFQDGFLCRWSIWSALERGDRQNG